MQFSWIRAATCGLAAAALTAGSLRAAEKEAPKDDSKKGPAPFWQMVIAPRYGAPAVADFYANPNGSLTVHHRMIRPGEYVGGPSAGEIAPLKEELAPPPAPVPPPPAPANGPALPAPKAQKPTGRKSAAASRPSLFRLAAQETAAADDRAVPIPTPPSPANPVLPAPPSKGSNGAPPMPRENARLEEAGPELKNPAPAEKSAEATEAQEDAGGGYDTPWPGGIRRPTYLDAYFSVPFFRSEYNANPSYRHEAAMEILFGQLRPTTIQKISPQPIAERYERSYYSGYTPFSYWNGRGYTNYVIYYPRPSQFRPW